MPKKHSGASPVQNRYPLSHPPTGRSIQKGTLRLLCGTSVLHRLPWQRTAGGLHLRTPDRLNEMISGLEIFAKAKVQNEEAKRNALVP